MYIVGGAHAKLKAKLNLRVHEKTIFWNPFGVITKAIQKTSNIFFSSLRFLIPLPAVLIFFNIAHIR